MIAAWISKPGTVHALWDVGAWLSAVGLFVVIYKTKPSLFERSTLVQVQHGYYAALSLGGFSGAYLIGTANLWLSGQPGIGRSILGGVVGATVAVELYKYRSRLSGSTGGAFALALALGIALGRIGCHYAGLGDYTYGNASNLPWAVDYGDGISRHPVALYEAATMSVLLLALLLMLRRAPSRLMREGFYWFCAVYGMQRFIWEFFKPYGLILGPFNLMHLVCVTLVGYAALMLYRSRYARPQP